MSTVGAPKGQTTCSGTYESNSPTGGGPAGATTRARLRRPRAAGADASDTSDTSDTSGIVIASATGAASVATAADSGLVNGWKESAGSVMPVMGWTTTEST